MRNCYGMKGIRCFFNLPFLRLKVLIVTFWPLFIYFVWLPVILQAIIYFAATEGKRGRFKCSWPRTFTCQRRTKLWFVCPRSKFQDFIISLTSLCHFYSYLKWLEENRAGRRTQLQHNSSVLPDGPPPRQAIPITKQDVSASSFTENNMSPQRKNETKVDPVPQTAAAPLPIQVSSYIMCLFPQWGLTLFPLIRDLLANSLLHPLGSLLPLGHLVRLILVICIWHRVIQFVTAFFYAASMAYIELSSFFVGQNTVHLIWATRNNLYLCLEFFP